MAQLISDGRIPVDLYSGEEVTVKKISLALLEKFDKVHVPPTPPMVEQTVVGGGTDLEEDFDDPEYLEELNEYNRKSLDDLLNLIVLRGMEFDLPEDDNWKTELSLIGISVPDDEMLERLDYAKLFMMDDTKGDIVLVMSTVLQLSGADEEAIQSWTDLF